MDGLRFEVHVTGTVYRGAMRKYWHVSLVDGEGNRSSHEFLTDSWTPKQAALHVLRENDLIEDYR